MLVVDDDVPTRVGVRAILSSDPGIEVVGEAGTAADVVELAARLNADVVLTDVRVPDDDGIDALLHIVRGAPHGATPPKVIALGREAGGAESPHTQFAGALTKRESEVLALIARGLSNAEIAEFLGLSIETVRTHVKHMYLKCGARDRAHAVIIAYEIGLARPRR